jgi:hypothetical protein
MAGMQDFRNYPFAQSRVELCGRYLGHNAYWKLYAIENGLRVILHSVLSAQYGNAWLDAAIEPAVKKRIEWIKSTYLAKKVHAMPGRHDVYFLYLPDLAKIMLVTANLIENVISDVDDWVVKIESIQTPRNLVGHMNFPNESDREKINKVHGELKVLIRGLERKLIIRIP